MADQEDNDEVVLAEGDRYAGPKKLESSRITPVWSRLIREVVRKRQSRGLSQQQVCEIIKVDRNVMKRFEAGRAEPGITLIADLIRVLEIDLGKVIYGRKCAVLQESAQVPSPQVAQDRNFSVQATGEGVKQVLDFWLNQNAAPGLVRVAGEREDGKIWAAAGQLIDTSFVTAGGIKNRKGWYYLIVAGVDSEPDDLDDIVRRMKEEYGNEENK